MISFIILLVFMPLAKADESVKYAAVIYRHGDRTPIKPYPTDPWKNESLWPVKFGELTNLGKKQHYLFGQWLRRRYSHLLSEQFDPTEVYVQSTDVDRTLMSAQANLAGMFPPVGQSVWDSDLMWQPIPVHTMPAKEDNLLAMQKPCPAYDKEYSLYINTNAFRERLSKYKGLMDYLSAHTGLAVEDYIQILDIYSVLYIENLYNYSLPNWTQAIYPNEIREPACYGFVLSTGTPLLARLNMGPLLKKIVNSIKHAISNLTISETSKYRKLNIYSAHDLNIGGMLHALGLFDGNCPQYTSAVFVELIQGNDTEHLIRISYRNSTENVEPHVLYIPHCGELCPVSRFIKLYQNLLTVNWTYDCGQMQFPIMLAASFLTGIGLFGTMYMTHKYYFQRVLRQYGLHETYDYTRVADSTIMSPAKLIKS